jgi:glucose-6-phosphate isomerase
MIHETNESPRASRYLDQLEGARVTARVWAGDATVWDPDPSEIANRLGWLRAPAIFRSQLEELRLFADIVRDEGCDAVALLGMGGSSLAPETLAAIGRHGDAPRLVVLDTTHPSAVRRALHGLNPTRTLYIVSTKSGTTTETLTLFRTLFRQAAAALGDRVGERFAAITDPGSPLVGVAREHRFRRVFLNDPTFGGRYAALSLVGLVPAALLGVDLDQLLDDAEAMAASSLRTSPRAATKPRSSFPRISQASATGSSN